LEAIFLAAFRGCELIAVASQLAEDTDILAGDKAALYKANAKQISDPFGILGIEIVNMVIPLASKIFLAISVL